MDRLLRMEEVAELTGLTLGTLRHYRLAGKGPRSSKLGKRVVYRAADVDAWVESQLEQTASDVV